MNYVKTQQRKIILVLRPEYKPLNLERGMMVHAFNPSMQEGNQADRSLSSSPAWSIEWIAGQQPLSSKPLSKNHWIWNYNHCIKIKDKITFSSFYLYFQTFFFKLAHLKAKVWRFKDVLIFQMTQHEREWRNGIDPLENICYTVI